MNSSDTEQKILQGFVNCVVWDRCLSDASFVGECLDCYKLTSLQPTCTGEITTGTKCYRYDSVPANLLSAAKAICSSLQPTSYIATGAHYPQQATKLFAIKTCVQATWLAKNIIYPAGTKKKLYHSKQRHKRIEN